MTDYVAQHVERTKRRKLSDRQRAVLAFAQARACLDQAFPTDAEIMARFPANFHNLTNVREALLGLHVRGFLEPVATDFTRRGQRIVTKWAITEAGWAAPLFTASPGA
jgi:hypothetical protein